MADLTTDGLNPATVAALNRAFEEMAERADQVNQSLARLQGVGGTSGPSGTSAASQIAGFNSRMLSGMDRQAALLTSILAALERNSAAVRFASAASAVSAVSSVRTGSAISSATTDIATETASAAVAAVRRRRARRAKKDPQADALHLRTIEEGDDLALRKADEDEAAEEQSHKAFDENSDLDEMRKEADRLGIPHKKQWNRKKFASEINNKRAAAKGIDRPREEKEIGKLRQAESNRKLDELDQTDPNDMTPAELNFLRSQGKAVPGAAAAVGGAGSGTFDVASLVAALKANTEAVIKNTKGRKGVGGSGGGGGEGGDGEEGGGKKRTWKDLSRELGGAAQGMAGMIGVAASASIGFDTLMSSVRGVAIEIGDAFTPALLTMSGYLQGAADWIATFDDGTKRWIASGALWTAGILGVGSVLTGMVPAIRASWAATTGWTLSVRLLAAAWAASPLGVIVTGLGLVAAGATAAAYAFGFMGSKAKEAGQGVQAGAAGGAGQQKTEPLRQADLDAAGVPRHLQAQIIANKQGEGVKLLAEYKTAQEDALQKVKGGQLGGLGDELEMRKIVEEERKNRRDAIAAKAKAAGIEDRFYQARYGTKEDDEAAVARTRARFLKAGITPDKGDAELAGNDDPIKFKPRGANVEAAGEINRLTRLIASLAGVQDRVGVGGDGVRKNLELPFKSRSLSYESYGESLQMEALNEETQSRHDQIRILDLILKELGGQSKFLDAIKGTNAETQRVLEGVFGS